MRIRWLAALALAFLAGGLVRAQPAKTTEQTLEVRLRSVNDLMDKAVYVGKLVGKDDVVLGVKQLLKNLSAEGKGIEGVDPKKPFGVYATLATDVVNSPFTVMVPIADKDRFLQMLKDRLDITPEKADGGTMKVKLPEQAQNPVLDAVYLRFSEDYLYIGRSAKDLDAKAIIAPKTFFGRDDGAVASVVLRGDRIPAEVKTFVVGQLELALAEQRKTAGARQDPVEKAVVDWVSETMVGGLKSVLEDSKELSVRLFIDDKADEFSVDATLTPQPGSPMAKYISSLAGKTSVPAGIVGTRNAVARGSVKVAMPEDMKKRFSGVVDDAIAGILKKTNDNEREMAKRVLETLAPTIKAAELDAAVAMVGPDANGKYSLIAAGMVKNGKEIEKLVKDFSQFAPADEVKFDFDVEKAGDFSLHKITINKLPPELEKVFGAKTVWLAVSDSIVAVSLEPDGAALKAGLKAKPAQVPVFSLDVSASRLIPLFNPGAKADPAAAGKDNITVTVTGGTALTAKATMKGKVVQLIAESGAFDKK
jgi:hypothetical protein